ncbi:BMC domain-containing protein [Horticoccus luteus]|uniref:BMC domain-containing protein n=1 Tax=Horticoccus luteus TaxID=2862869 RepID=A0A8F9TWZ1_9BACT|nr:BMC domain-containing protein [Horticoccus luteus]QYM80686.1 BMC domain-containing protein [Horticoccus luteus]
MPARTERPPAVALLEIHSLGAALVVLDRVEKAAFVQVLQAELNDYYGLFLKLTGDVASVRLTVEAACATAQAMKVAFTARALSAPDAGAWPVIEAASEFQPLLDQEVVFIPRPRPSPTMADSSSPSEAIGLIETQGFTAVTAAADAACKAANVRLIAKEKLGGGYITVIFEGDVAGVTAAVAAGRAAAESVGKLISAHVIARPSDGVGRILTRL